MRAAALDAAGDARPVRIPLSVNDPNAGPTLSRCVERMLRSGSRAPVVVELHGSHLPAPLVAALIGNLRRLREAGIALAASPASPAMRNAMALHGLDRVLARSTVAPAPRRRATAETAWPLFALLLLMVTVASVMLLLQQAPGYGGI